MVIIMIGSEDVTKKDVMKRGCYEKNVAGKQKTQKRKGTMAVRASAFFQAKVLLHFLKAKIEKNVSFENNFKYVHLKMKSFKGTTIWFRAQSTIAGMIIQCILKIQCILNVY